jgi:hypothetical protein
MCTVVRIGKIRTTPFDSIPFDLSSRPFVPLPCFIRSRFPTPLLGPSLVFFPLRGLPKLHMLGVCIGFSCHHSFSVTLFYPVFVPFNSPATRQKEI